jgi:molybdopterin/thiamine biosynthesis adenylyltransferase/rhodanese-related sulfurtransferase
MDARYARQLALPGFGERGQQRLGTARVLVVGAGGLGSAVIPLLAGAGVGRLTLIDDDVVEPSNLHRQTIHRADAVGSPKAESAAAFVAALNPGVEVTALVQRLTTSTALDLFVEHDLVLDGSDTFPTRYLVDDAARLTGIPSVWGAVSQYGGQVGVAWAGRGPTYRDLFPVPPAPDSVLTCAVGGVLPSVCGVIGSLMAGEALKILSGLDEGRVGQPLIGRVTTYDALTGGFRELAYAADPDAPPVTGLIDYDAFCGVAPSAGAGGASIDAPSPNLTPTQLEARLGEVTLLDVREPWEAEIAMIPGAILIPLGALPLALDSLDRSRPIVAYCHHGIRSESARALLADAGFDVSHLTGGIDAWSTQVDPQVPSY